MFYWNTNFLWVFENTFLQFIKDTRDIFPANNLTVILLYSGTEFSFVVSKVNRPLLSYPFYPTIISQSYDILEQRTFFWYWMKHAQFRNIHSGGYFLIYTVWVQYSFVDLAIINYCLLPMWKNTNLLSLLVPFLICGSVFGEFFYL